MQSFRRNQKTGKTPFQGIRNTNQNKTNIKVSIAKTTKTHAPIDIVDYISTWDEEDRGETSGYSQWRKSLLGSCWKLNRKASQAAAARNYRLQNETKRIEK